MFLNNGIVVQPDEAKVGTRLRTIVNVGVVDREEEAVFLIEGKWGCMRISSKKCATRSVETAVWPALVKVHGVIDILVVDRRQDA